MHFKHLLNCLSFLILLFLLQGFGRSHFLHLDLLLSVLLCGIDKGLDDLLLNVDYLLQERDEERLLVIVIKEELVEATEDSPVYKMRHDADQFGDFIGFDLIENYLYLEASQMLFQIMQIALSILAMSSITTSS